MGRMRCVGLVLINEWCGRIGMFGNAVGPFNGSGSGQGHEGQLRRHFITAVRNPIWSVRDEGVIRL